MTSNLYDERITFLKFQIAPFLIFLSLNFCLRCPMLCVSQMRMFFGSSFWTKRTDSAGNHVFIHYSPSRIQALKPGLLTRWDFKKGSEHLTLIFPSSGSRIRPLAIKLLIDRFSPPLLRKHLGCLLSEERSSEAE